MIRTSLTDPLSSRYYSLYYPDLLVDHRILQRRRYVEEALDLDDEFPNLVSFGSRRRLVGLLFFSDSQQLLMGF